MIGSRSDDMTARFWWTRDLAVTPWTAGIRRHGPPDRLPHRTHSADARADAPSREFLFRSGEEWHRSAPGECMMWICGYARVSSVVTPEKEREISCWEPAQASGLWVAAPRAVSGRPGRRGGLRAAGPGPSRHPQAPLDIPEPSVAADAGRCRCRSLPMPVAADASSLPCRALSMPGVADPADAPPVVAAV